MPCIWGEHDNSNIFLDVTIVPAISTMPTIPVAYNSQMMQSLPRFRALLDTGAQSTCITRVAATKMGLPSAGTCPIHGVSGTQDHNSYLFQVGLFLDMSFIESDGNLISRGMLSILNKKIRGAEFSAMDGEFDVLLGMDVISTGSLKVEGNGTFSFSF